MRPQIQLRIMYNCSTYELTIKLNFNIKVALSINKNSKKKKRKIQIKKKLISNRFNNDSI